MAAPSGKLRRRLNPSASFKLPRHQVFRLRMESWLPNWQNRIMNSGGASGCGGFSELPLRQAASRASLPPVPSFQLGPFGTPPRMLRCRSLRPQNNGRAKALWNPSQFNQPRAITMGSTGRVVSSWPASPGWLNGRAG